jgi:hypothetical protein
MQASSSDFGEQSQSLPGGTARDDHVLLVTRAVSALVVPFVIAAFVVLYVLPYPEGVIRYFAWIVRPQMSAMLMGAGYLAGGYFFARAAIALKWHHVAIGFPGVTAFTSLVLIATIIHWDSFTHGQMPFYIWVVLYAITPFIVPGLWLLNRRTDPGVPDERDALIPALVRWLVCVMGAIALAASLSFLLAPGFMMGIWPWQLSPATSRVAAAWFSLFAVVALVFPFERRWSAVRVILQSLMLAIALFLVAVARAWDEFDKSNPLTWLFVCGLAFLLVASAALYTMMEHRCRMRKEG